jgi:hypothetical protein
MAPPSKVWLFFRVIAMTGARCAASASVESKTLGAPLRAVDGGTRDQVQFVDEPCAQKRSVGPAASLKQQPLDAEFAVEDVQCQDEIEMRLSGEDVGHALAAQGRQVRIRDVLRKHDHDRIATNFRTAQPIFP